MAKPKRRKIRQTSIRQKADNADELQRKLDELEAGNLTELEKANKALDTANQQIAELQKKKMLLEILREKAMTDFKVTAEQAKNNCKRRWQL